jgi:hypothetical protein
MSASVRALNNGHTIIMNDHLDADQIIVLDQG